ncbi:right-handed parallel beta-helix repeat-containing protein [Methanobrevibacter filiformis]|uniref:Chlamydia polymorphic membrane protein n=1 Tax=Methanobrevibacter filiformis TaxID=55758 RepID=A0A166D151_9EURY|nr:hypothetical protein [Methanobrevibacter filiformis]KZX15093.1 chlamydia polymorphic membrane protein [Methanobrevibacter filiformis]
MKKKYLKTIVVLALLLCFAISISAASAKDIYVSKGGSIKNAVSKAKSGDTIYIKAGTYSGTKNRDIIIDNNKNIKISAISNNVKKRNTVVISLGKANRAFTISRGTVTLSGIKITNGKKDLGGAIAITKGKLTIRYCSFTNNVATKYGGAIFAKQSKLNVSKSTFTNNKAKISGGGISHFNNKLIVDNSTFTSNRAGNGKVANTNFGGGIHTTDNSNANIKGSYFTKNVAYGGAIANFGKMNLTTSVFEKNRSPKNGGAIAIEENAKLEKCNFTGNVAAQRGGAIHNAGKTTIKSSRFTYNKALRGFAGGFDTHAPLKVYNSVISHNTASHKSGGLGGAFTLYRFSGSKEKYHYASDVLIQGCTITYNSAGKTGTWGESVFITNGDMPYAKTSIKLRLVGNTWKDENGNIVKNTNWLCNN